MEEKKEKAALNDEALEQVAGGKGDHEVTRLDPASLGESAGESHGRPPLGPGTAVYE